jgi:mycoketide-CoA synthase
MIAVAASEQEVAEVLEAYPEVAVAAVNGPRAVVISGAEGPVAGAAEQLAATGARTRRLRVSHAFHSPLMGPMLAEFAEVTRSVSYQVPQVPLVSTLTGVMANGEVTDPEYWVRHVREPVRFSDAVTALREAGVRTFVEIGPDGALSALGQDVPGAGEAQDEAWLPALRRDGDEAWTLVNAVAGVYARGGRVDWARFYAGAKASRVDLPTYTFQHQRYWLSPGGAGRPEDLGLGTLGHPLLGAAVELAGGGGLVLTGRLSATAQPWLGDHVIGGRTLVPGTALVELAVRAGDAAGCGRVEELLIEVPLVLPARGWVQVQVTVAAADEAGRRQIAVYARAGDSDPDGPWTRHAAGWLAPVRAGAVPLVQAGAVAPVLPGADGWLEQWPPAGATAVDLEGLYPALEHAGYRYGPAFRGVRAAWRRGAEIFAEIALPEGTQVAGYGVHPALLDAALHLTVADGGERADQIVVPFAWGDVTVHATGAVAARVRVAPSASGDGLSVTLADGAGELVATAGSLLLRALPSGPGTEMAGMARESLYRLEWVPVAQPDVPAMASRTVVLGPDGGLNLPGMAHYPDLAALAAAVTAGHDAPDTVITCCLPTESIGGYSPGAAWDTVAGLLEVVQGWLAEESLEASRLVVVTRRAVDAGPDTPVDVSSSAACGLIRAAQSENPGRLVLADTDEIPGAAELIMAGAGLGEPEFAIRGGELRVRRLARVTDTLAVPGGDWRLAVTARGTLGNLWLAGTDEGRRSLASGEVRVGLRAAGVNFRDVLNALGMYPGEAGQLGLEGAGIVLETGPGVTGLAPGDAVMGLFSGAFGPVAVADARLLAPVPSGWSLVQAGAAPVVFLTAYHALVNLAGLRAGESVLIHAAAGGVGMAAVQLARYLGAEVYGTASPGKWSALRALGLDDAHLASSRTTEFEQLFLAATGNRGMDVVLDSLAGEFVDASLRLTAARGRFIEMGKTDIRDPAQVEDAHQVAYRAFDLLETDPDRIAQMFTALGALFADGILDPLPVTCWDARRAPEAFRYLSQARNVGKIVLTIPSPSRNGTVLMTGASGALGRLMARHLVTSRGVRYLVLLSRRGMAAPEMAAVVAELAGLGAEVRVAACDAANRGELAAVIESIPADAPLRGVIHAAGALDDAVIGALTPGRMAAVMRPKADAAWHLHELTDGLDLDMFVLFSSVAGIFGTSGQGNYAAANTFLDALATHRHRQGMAATSLAWGPWQLPGGMAGQLTEMDWQRMARQGLRPVADAEGLALLDAADTAGEALLVPAPLDLNGLRSRGDSLPALLSSLIRPARRAVGQVSDGQDDRVDLAARLAALPAAERDEAVRQLVLTQAAQILGMAGPETVDAGRSFREMGFDSLTGVELRNRLNSVTGMRLPATVIFDYPTPATLAGYLRGETSEQEADYLSVLKELDRLESVLSGISRDSDGKSKIMTRLAAIMEDLRSEGADSLSNYHDIDVATDDEIFKAIENELGI